MAAGRPPLRVPGRVARGPRPGRSGVPRGRGRADRGGQGAVGGGGPGRTDPAGRMGRVHQLPRGPGRGPRQRGPAGLRPPAGRSVPGPDGPGRGPHLRLRPRDQLRGALRGPRGSRPQQPGLHRCVDHPAHRQPLPGSRTDPPTAALSAQRGGGRGLRAGRRLPRRRAAARAGSGGLRGADPRAGGVRLRRRALRTAGPPAADRCGPARADPRGPLQQPLHLHAAPARRRAGGVLRGLPALRRAAGTAGAAARLPARARRLRGLRQHPSAARPYRLLRIGGRHLQGTYADLDGLLSTLAVLRREGAAA